MTRLSLSLGLCAAFSFAPGCAPTLLPSTAVWHEQSPFGTPANVPSRNNLLLGNPIRAAKNVDDYLVERPQHALSYNKSRGAPNWVAWHLDKSDLGRVRRGTFLPDPLLPVAMQIRPDDYRGSGYDRGHLCPSGDRTATRTDNTATFVMSNMVPQAAALNQHVWKDLEEYCRYLVRQPGDKASELYIISGGSGSAGRIARGKVNVPAVCWKIIVVLPIGDNDLKRINARTRVIAVAMPNRQRPEIADSKWSRWITSVAKIEKTTGYDFLSALPDNVEKALEAQVDSGRADIQTGSATKKDAEPFSTSPSTRMPGAEISNVETPSTPAPGQTLGAVQVWVNTRSGVYHFSGTRYYGKTKEGEYMTEAQAIAHGYHAARNGQ